MRSHRRVIRAACLAAVLLAPMPSGAQEPAVPSRMSFGIVAGVSQFDLSGTGTTPIAGLRLDRIAIPWLVAEGAVGVLRPTEQGGRRAWYLVPEAQLQLQRPRGALRPYVGAGGGWFSRQGSGGRTTGTLSGAVGVRASRATVPWDARAELRVRGIGSGFSGSGAEWTVGAAYRF